MYMNNNDYEMFNLIRLEKRRQNNHLELIASENIVSKDVLNAQGSILTNKYAEGYPSKRYYGGCQIVDLIEECTKNRLKKLFNVKYVNVQPHSGTQANMAVYRALLKKGDAVLSMGLEFGGHLSHGSSLSFSGQDYQIFHYGVNKITEKIDYEEVKFLAHKYKVKMIIAGASSYPRIIDFSKFREICDEVGALLFVDMAHIAGLVATKNHPNPCDFADIVTSTTHKTLRGPRGGIILSNNEEIMNKINKTIFPGIQGGPLMHVIAAKGICFKEASTKEFKIYINQVLKSSKKLAKEFMNKGYHVITNGTDNHLVLIDVKEKIGINGKKAEEILDSINITVNKNMIPFDQEKPYFTSGIRIGTASLVSRGFKEHDMVQIVNIINKAFINYENPKIMKELKKEVMSLCKKYPII